MKSICICGPYPDPVGGVSVHVRRLSKVVGAEYSVKLIDESPLIKLNVFNIRSFDFIRYIKLIKTSDIIHVNSSVMIFRFIHVLFATLLFKKTVVTVHSYREASKLHTLLNKVSFKLASANIVVSVEISKKFPFEHVVIPAFIRPSSEDLFLSDFFLNLVRQIRNDGKKVVVSNAYRLDVANGREIYGFSDLLSLFSDPEINEKHSLILNVSTLSGCVDQFEKFKKYIFDNKLDNSIFLYNEQLNFSGLLKHSDIFIRATSTDGDALSVRESLLLGVKTIASDCVFRPQGTILYKDGDISSLKQNVLFGMAPEITDTISFESKILEIYKGLL